MAQEWGGVPPGEPIPGKTYRADGWVYRDLPTWLSPNMKDLFFSIIGVENTVILASSERTIDDVKYWRGQLLISPAGIENMRNAKATQ